MSDRKHMKKLREKRIEAIQKQIEIHETSETLPVSDGAQKSERTGKISDKKILTEKGNKDTTPMYWRTEIEKKFKKLKHEDEEYLKENES